MKLTISIVLVLVAVHYGFSQYAYDKGYFINNSGERTDCLIRRLDGEYNPKKVEYKTDERSTSITLGVTDVSEFGITGEAVFIRATVNMDRSRSDLNKATSGRNPEWSSETLFLKILVAGEANLYIYKEDGLTRFFYNTRVTEIEQLVYKAYYPYPNQVAYNRAYLEQLQRTLICDKMPQKINVPYQAKPLESLFRKYNECKGVSSDYVVTETKAPVTASISFRPGFNFSSFTATAKAGIQEFTADFNSKLTFRAGVELEIFPSFNNRNKKWSLTVEPNYHYYNDEFTEDDKTYTVRYSAIEIPLGLRRYFYLPKNKAIFLNINLVYDFPLSNSGGQIPSNFITGAVFEYQIVSSMAAFAGGIGFSVRKFFGEFRAYSYRDLTEGSATFGSSFSNVAFILGYRFK
jgi:hypothetical protein